uniref:Single-stranded DNA-binding protein n=3 Tax=Oryza TaxID=4527 RepID=A0A0E0DCZ7_9ORYZ
MGVIVGIPNQPTPTPPQQIDEVSLPPGGFCSTPPSRRRCLVGRVSWHAPPATSPATSSSSSSSSSAAAVLPFLLARTWRRRRDGSEGDAADPLFSVLIAVYNDECEIAPEHEREEAPRTAKKPKFYRKLQAWNSTASFSDVDEKNGKGRDAKDDFTHSRPDHVFRGVHRAIICGKVGQVPVQKILRNGHTVTVFTVGTGGMFDQRTVGAENLPMPAQWHRISVHNEQLVYVEGDIETRVYNDRINDQVKSIPEICVRRDGKIQLMQSGDSDVSKSLEELKKHLPGQ